MLSSPYIWDSEYRCRCCGKFPPDFDANEAPWSLLFYKFKRLREAKCKPIIWNRGYSCPLHNQEIGGVEISAHLFGLAGDLRCNGHEDLKETEQLVERYIPEVRMGVYKQGDTQWVHIDIAYLIYPRATPMWKEGVRWYK